MVAAFNVVITLRHLLELAPWKGHKLYKVERRLASSGQATTSFSIAADITMEPIAHNLLQPKTYTRLYLVSCN